LLGVDLYTGNRSDKAKLILESIEESFNLACLTPI